MKSEVEDERKGAGARQHAEEEREAEDARKRAETRRRAEKEREADAAKKRSEEESEADAARKRTDEAFVGLDFLSDEHDEQVASMAADLRALQRHAELPQGLSASAAQALAACAEYPSGWAHGGARSPPRP